MRTSKRQSASFRNAFWAEKSREAYVLAKRGGEFAHLCFDADIMESYEYEVMDGNLLDLSVHAPTPSSTGWEGLGA